MYILHFAMFVVALFLIFAGIAFMTQRKRLMSHPGRVLLAGAFLAVFGPMGEIAVGNFYQHLFGFPLWQYHVFPVHDAYTSLIAPFIWAVAGTELYFIQPYLERFIRNRWLRHAAMAVEILLLEVLINAGADIFLGGRFFYYTPGELLHYSSFQTLPFYFLASVVIVRANKSMQSRPIFYSLLCAGAAYTVVFLAS